MQKRSRNHAEQEVVEGFAGLLRQSASRAVERLKMQRPRYGALAHADTNAMGAGGPVQGTPSGAPADNARGGGRRPTMKPIDVLVVQYVVHYLDLQAVPSNHYIRLSQDLVTTSPDRVLQPQVFARKNLPRLCEDLVAENTAAVVEDTLKEVEEFVDVREILGEWLAERVGGGEEFDDEDEFDERAEIGSSAWRNHDKDGGEAHGDGPAHISLVDLAGLLYSSLEYWLRIRDFLLALSRSGANAYAVKLKPRYERELMTVLLDVASSSTSSSRTVAAAARGEVSMGTTASGEGSHVVGAGTSAPPSAAHPGKDSATKMESSVKQEPLPEDEGGAPLDTAAMIAAAAAVAGGDQEDNDEDDDEAYMNDGGGERNAGKGSHAAYSAKEDPAAVEALQHRRDVATAVLADVLALAHCRTERARDADDAPGERAMAASESLRARAKGVDPRYYAMVHARLGVMVSRDRLRQFSAAAQIPTPPPLTVAQRNLLEREEAARQAAEERRRAMASDAAVMVNGAAVGVPLDYVPDDQYFQRVLAQQHDTVGEDEEIYKEEVVDYYLKKQQQLQQQQQHVARGANANRGRANHNNRGGDNSGNQTNDKSQPQPLVKPHRYCKVKTGYTWTQYNRTHYDSRTNPPPRTILWYEFTLFYPALVNTKRDMRNIFHIEDTPKGPTDDYCLLVFSVGPPYEDVAYRIVRKQWDTRRGGVRISFDATGKYKLFFRFTNSNYRR